MVNMQKESLFSLCWRNLKGIWTNFSHLAANVYEPAQAYAVIFYFLLLPLFVILSPIKSLIDYFTRKPSSVDDYDKAVDALSSMSDDDVEAYAKTISEQYPSPQSKSSHVLGKILKASTNEKQIYSGLERAKKNEKLIEILDNNGLTIRPEFRWGVTVTLLESELEQIKVATVQQIEEAKPAFIKSKREGLIGFFTAGHNIGKKTHQVIMDVVLSENKNRI